MTSVEFGRTPCGLSGCRKSAKTRCDYCGLPLCNEHDRRIPASDRESYCPECFLYLDVSGLLARPTDRRVRPKVLVVDPGRCTGCRSCQLVCSFRLNGTYSNSWAAIRVLKQEAECLNVPVVCEQCPDAACIEACPMEALRWDEGSGLVLLDEELCNGCGVCLAACPHQAIFSRPGAECVVKCDLCRGEPRCVSVCETKALDWVHKHEAGERTRAVIVRNRVSLPGQEGGEHV